MSKHTPGPWGTDARFMSIVTTNVKIGGPAKLFDVRGWGYLTGMGHGGLGLDPDAAYEIQKANARLASAAPDLLAALKAILDSIEVNDDWAVSKALAAIAKAEGK